MAEVLVRYDAHVAELMRELLRKSMVDICCVNANLPVTRLDGRATSFEECLTEELVTETGAEDPAVRTVGIYICKVESMTRPMLVIC